MIYKWNDNVKEIVETQPYELFTDVPFRPTFPRGFLWDSGFHNLIISRWDRRLSLEIIKSWISRIDENGWIAREQIPGEEARSKVPTEYRVQNPRYANPPALLLALLSISESLNPKEDTLDMETLKLLFPGFKKNLEWYLKTQIGKLHPQGKSLLSTKHVSEEQMAFFRWRGRSKHHTLTSGT